MSKKCYHEELPRELYQRISSFGLYSSMLRMGNWLVHSTALTRWTTTDGLASLHAFTKTNDSGSFLLWKLQEKISRTISPRTLPMSKTLPAHVLHVARLHLLATRGNKASCYLEILGSLLRFCFQTEHSCPLAVTGASWGHCKHSPEGLDIFTMRSCMVRTAWHSQISPCYNCYTCLTLVWVSPLML